VEGSTVVTTMHQNITSIDFDTHACAREGGKVAGNRDPVNALFSCSGGLRP
jgi:hypothetical protein